MDAITFDTLGPERAPTTPLSTLDRFLAMLVGADPDMLRECPGEDMRNVRTLAPLPLLVWIFQTWMWSYAAHMVLAEPGAFHLAYVAFAALLATIVLLLDVYLIFRSGWFRHGEAELRRGGMDVSGGRLARFKHMAFMLVRLLIAAGFAQLTALLLSLILFAPDIAGDLEQRFRQHNAELFAAAATRVEREIAGTEAALDTANNRIEAMTVEMTRLRQVMLEPIIDEPRLPPALERVARLEAVKSEADGELAEAELFAADELGGIRRAPGNTGIPGVGPVRAAAEERVTSTRRRAQNAAQELAAARAELREIEESVASAAAQKQEHARLRLQETSEEEQAERTRHGELSALYRGLVDNREARIRDVVLRDARHAPEEKGFLANVQALGRIAQDPISASVILLFEAVGFAVEFAAVLGKLLVYAPTYYERRLAREHYLDAHAHAQAIDRILRESENGSDPAEGSGLVPTDLAQAPASPGNGAGVPAPSAESTSASEPPRRKRGRPPKPKPPSEDAVAA